MNAEQHPPQGRDAQAFEQNGLEQNGLEQNGLEQNGFERHTAPVDLERTMPLVSDPAASYPPPTGSPFVHLPPSPFEPPAVAPSGVTPTAPRLPGSDAAMASPASTGSAQTRGPGGRGGPGGLGPGAISAMVAGALAFAMVSAVLGGITGGFLVSRRDSAAVSLPAAPAGSSVRPPGSIADIAARSLPSVVTIKVAGAGVSGTGSGFILRKDGYILTNNHVVDAAATGTITVLFSDGKSADAKIIGRDQSYDLAVIRVDRTDLPALALGASSAVVVGDPVIAVGAPLGLESTVTSGIVSALNRPVTPPGGAPDSTAFINAIQTDAAINPGNSGGPLLDMAGRVIGVNSAIARLAGSDNPAGGQSGSIGVGFAIPSDQVRKTAAQLIATGKATHPVIGVMLDTTYKGQGVRVAAVAQDGTPPITKGGPADKAGLQPGDVILTFGGRPITGPDEFVVAIRARSVGDRVELTVRHGTSERGVKMTLQAAN